MLRLKIPSFGQYIILINVKNKEKKQMVDKGKKKSSSVIAVNQESFATVHPANNRGTNRMDIKLPSKRPPEKFNPTWDALGNKISFPRNKLKKKK